MQWTTLEAFLACFLLPCPVVFPLGEQHREQMDTSGLRVKTDLVSNLSFTMWASCLPSLKPIFPTRRWKMEIIMDLHHGAA